jgi:hypothetical protein
MKPIKVIILMLSVFMSSCYFKLTHRLKELNPMEYIYNLPIYEVRNIIKSNFSDNKFYGLSYNCGQVKYINESSASYTLQGDQNNIILEYDTDFYTHSKIKSEIYYNWWGRLKLYPHYHISLDSISPNKTKISVASSPSIKTGIAIGCNHGFPSSFGPYLVDVKPSTIEEYKIIKTIGDALNEKDMPAIKYP